MRLVLGGICLVLADNPAMPATWNGVEVDECQWTAARERFDGLHSAPYCYVPVSGRLRCCWAGHDGYLNPGQMACWPSGLHGTVFAGGADVSGYIIRFRRSGFSASVVPDAEAWQVCQQLEWLGRVRGVRLPVRRETVGAIQELCKEMMPIWRLHSHPQRALHLKAGGLRILALLVADRRWQKRMQEVPAMGMDQRIERVLNWLDENIDHAIDVDGMASQAGLSRSRFTQLFREQLGCSALDHLRRLRIARACRLLSHSDMAVTDVAYAVGFGSQARFQASFSRIMGCSPGRWKRKIYSP